MYSFAKEIPLEIRQKVANISYDEKTRTEREIGSYVKMCPLGMVLYLVKRERIPKPLPREFAETLTDESVEVDVRTRKIANSARIFMSKFDNHKMYADDVAHALGVEYTGDEVSWGAR